MSEPVVPEDGVRSRQRQLAGDLRARILAGDIAAGERLPSTAELKRRYEVTNMTVTRAMAILKAEGLVEGHQGKSVVATGRRPAVIRAGHYPSAQDVAMRLVGVGEVAAPAEVAGAFGGEGGGLVVVREQIGFVGDEPAELVWNYYPVELARGTALAQPRRLRGGSPAILTALGQTPRSATDQVSVRPATVAESRALRLPGDIPVLRQFRITRTGDGTPVEATIMIKAGQHFEIRYDLPLA